MQFTPVHHSNLPPDGWETASLRGNMVNTSPPTQQSDKRLRTRVLTLEVMRRNTGHYIRTTSTPLHGSALCT